MKTVILPRNFKTIGIILMILSFLIAIIVKALNPEMLSSHKPLMRLYTLNGFILGLFFVAWSKDKIEDEMTVHVRLNAIAWTFSWAVFYVIFKPMADLLLKDPIVDLTGQDLVLSMLSVYLIMYYFQKRRR